MSLPGACRALARRLGNPSQVVEALSGQSLGSDLFPPRCYPEGGAAERPEPFQVQSFSQAPACVPCSVGECHGGTGGGSYAPVSQTPRLATLDESQRFLDTSCASLAPSPSFAAAPTIPFSSLQPPRLPASHWRSIHWSSRVNASEPAAEEAEVSISRAGPLAEYRHRVAQGTLHEGDEFQVSDMPAPRTLLSVLSAVCTPACTHPCACGATSSV